MTENVNVIGVILLGGQSKRMGKDKKYLLYKNKTFIELIINLLMELNCEEIILSGKSENDTLLQHTGISNCKIKYMSDTANYGPLSGVFQALSNGCLGKWMLFVPIDMPLLNKEVINLLIYRILHNKCEINAICFDGYVFPFLLRNSKEVYLAVREQVDKGEHSLKSVLEKLNALRLIIDKQLQIQLTNVNTPGEYVLL